MNSVTTFIATIYVGTRVGRTAEPNARVHSVNEIRDVCQCYCDKVGLCVSVAPTTFIYTHGREDGAAVGLINYPRFPSTPEAITAHALRLAELLKSATEQLGVSVVLPDRTIFLDESTPAPGAGERK